MSSIQARLVGTSEVLVEGSVIQIGSALSSSMSVGWPSMASLTMRTQNFTLSATGQSVISSGPLSLTADSTSIGE